MVERSRYEPPNMLQTCPSSRGGGSQMSPGTTLGYIWLLYNGSQKRKNGSATSECFENVLTRKSYSTPVYLIKIFEIGPVVLELGHFEARGPKKRFFFLNPKNENVMKNFHLEKSLQNHMGSRKIEIQNFEFFDFFRLF